MQNQPFVSVIIPVHNGGGYIRRCLDALITSSYSSFEIVVVDDCSTDNTASIARERGVTVLQLTKQSGPAVARNFGAKHARGEIFLFIDSDIIVRRDTIALVVENFQKNPDIVAVFGSYDDDPAERNFISQYRNLFHHYHHQHANTEAFTFWAGCGAIRKNVFQEMKGFNHEKYVKPSIEDIELGYRIHEKGYRIIMDKNLQVKHLKRWEFMPMLRTDIFQRAIPWSRLIIETKSMPNDLNLKISHKISSISIAFLILLIPCLLFGHKEILGISLGYTAGIISFLLFINILFLNRKVYGFYIRRRGLRFMIQVIPLHLLYYLYSGLSFVFCWVTHKISIFNPLHHIREN